MLRTILGGIAVAALSAAAASVVSHVVDTRLKDRQQDRNRAEREPEVLPYGRKPGLAAR